MQMSVSLRAATQVVLTISLCFNQERLLFQASVVFFDQGEHGANLGHPAQA
jgi:hypothetical protein